MSLLPVGQVTVPGSAVVLSVAVSALVRIIRQRKPHGSIPSWPCVSSDGRAFAHECDDNVPVPPDAPKATIFISFHAG